ncbi:hypothetical protein [Thioclava sp. GXIMD4216]|uniref:hypothetical protein n=1 Tax=Thioclava sp. GXIMD4216 TaxID=3131929 RepID=UPI0030CDF752
MPIVSPRPPKLHRILERDGLAIDYCAGQGADLVISFSSIGHDPSRLPAPEFVASATGHRAQSTPRPALFVMDHHRRWGNAPEFSTSLRDAFAYAQTQGPVRHVTAMGLSMGAYCALIATQILPVQAVLAFGPQSSLQQAATGCARWRDWIAPLKDPRWPVAPLPPATCHTVLAHGLEDDLVQARGFGLHSSCDHLLFPTQSHASLVPHLKARGCLAGLVTALIAGDRRRLLRILQAAGGLRRKTEDIAPPTA